MACSSELSEDLDSGWLSGFVEQHVTNKKPIKLGTIYGELKEKANNLIQQLDDKFIIFLYRNGCSREEIDKFLPILKKVYTEEDQLMILVLNLINTLKEIKNCDKNALTKAQENKNIEEKIGLWRNRLVNINELSCVPKHVYLDAFPERPAQGFNEKDPEIIIETVKRIDEIISEYCLKLQN